MEMGVPSVVVRLIVDRQNVSRDALRQRFRERLRQFNSLVGRSLHRERNDEAFRDPAAPLLGGGFGLPRYCRIVSPGSLADHLTRRRLSRDVSEMRQRLTPDCRARIAAPLG